MGRLDGKVVIITGANSGMGKGTALLFAREGAQLMIAARRQEEGRKVEAEIRDGGGEATFVPMDVSKWDDWAKLIELTETKYGKLDILINNAGTSGGTFVETTTLETWQRVIDVNAKDVFLGTKLAIPPMIRAGGGSIVNVASITGMFGVGHAAYGASKGAIRAFTKVIAIQHAKDNIRCNSIQVGPIDTPMLREALEDQEDVKSVVLALNIPLNRLGTPLDIAYSLLYFASDESSFTTGAEMVIDGGVIIS